MDVFERVREVNTAVHLSDDRVANARSRLLEGIEASGAATRKRVSRRPMFIIVGAVAGVAAATATVMVVGQLTMPTPQVEAVPAATLEPRHPGETIPHPAPTAGTGITEAFPGTTPQAGQYLSIQSVDDSLMYRGSDGFAYQWFYRPADSLPLSAAIMRSYTSLYMPADRSGEWVGAYGPANERLLFYPEAQDSGSLDAWDEVVPVRSEIDRWTYTGGIGGDTAPLSGSLESYAQYPQDPQALIQYFLDRASGESTTSDPLASATLNIADVLVTNYAPAEMRAVFLEALRLSSRAELVSEQNGLLTYLIRTDDWQGARTTTLTIDGATGWATEYAVRFDRTDGEVGDMAPDDAPDIHRTFTVAIIDAIP